MRALQKTCIAFSLTQKIIKWRYERDISLFPRTHNRGNILCLVNSAWQHEMAFRMTFHTIHFPAPEFTHAHNCDVFGVRDRPIFPRCLSGAVGADPRFGAFRGAAGGEVLSALRCSLADLNYSTPYEFKSITAFSDIGLSTKKRFVFLWQRGNIPPSIGRKDRHSRK